MKKKAVSLGSVDNSDFNVPRDVGSRLMNFQQTLAIILLCMLPIAGVFAWNALGHQLVAQIAYDNMTGPARLFYSQYNHAMDKIYKPLSWVNAAVWLDTLRYQDISWFSTMHYVDLPFSNDNSLLPPLQTINAVWAIEKSTVLLSNKYANNVDKGVALRVLLHVVGDIHQPLHTATRISAQFPQGDRGGNLVPLHGNRIAKNLHAYWDKGAGSLTPKHRYSQTMIAKRAASIEHRWPCKLAEMNIDPMSWAIESHDLAINSAYKELPRNNIPDKTYQRLTKKIVEQQISLAGCRLAALLMTCGVGKHRSNATVFSFI